MRTLVMTGGTRGFGLHVVRNVLATADWRVIVLGRARPSTPEVDFLRHPRLTFIEADLSDLKMTDRACTAVLESLQGQAIAALVCNAGLQSSVGPEASMDGLELHFAVNHLAHVLIADRLGPHVERGGRIILTSSVVHDPAAFCLIGIARVTWQDPTVLADPLRSQAHVVNQVDRGEARYSASKLCNVLHARALAREYPELAVVAFNPGVVPATDIVRHRDALQRFLWHTVLPVIAPVMPGVRSLAISSADLTWLILEAQIKALSGTYFDGRQPSAGSLDSRDPAKAERLMLVSRNILADVLGLQTEVAPSRA